MSTKKSLWNFLDYNTEDEHEDDQNESEQEANTNEENSENDDIEEEEEAEEDAEEDDDDEISVTSKSKTSPTSTNSSSGFNKSIIIQPVYSKLDSKMAKDIFSPLKNGINSSMQIENDFSDDVHLRSTPSKRHGIFDNISWVRNSTRVRSKSGHMAIGRNFLSKKVGVDSCELYSFAVTAKIYRMDPPPSPSASFRFGGMENSHIDWFRIVFGTDDSFSLNKTGGKRQGMLKIGCSPILFSQEICSILHSLSIPVQDSTIVSNAFTDPPSIALYVASTFLQRDYVDPVSLVGHQVLGYPYVIELEAKIGLHDAYDCNGDKVNILDTNIATWTAGIDLKNVYSDTYSTSVRQSPYVSSSSSGMRTTSSTSKRGSQQQHQKMLASAYSKDVTVKKRILLWKSKMSQNYWSDPIDLDHPHFDHQFLCKTLIDTHPTEREWIEKFILNPKSFGARLWNERFTRIDWSLSQQVESNRAFLDIVTSVINDNTIVINSRTGGGSVSGHFGSLSSSSSSNSLNGFLGVRQHFPYYGSQQHSPTTLAHYFKSSRSNGVTSSSYHNQGQNKQGSSSSTFTNESLVKEHQFNEWRQCLSIFSSRVFSIESLSSNPLLLQMLYNSGSFPIQPEDLVESIKYIPPCGSFFLDPSYLLWTSKRTKIVFCGTFCTIVEIPSAHKINNSSKKKGKLPTVIAKMIDMSSMCDQYVLTSGSESRDDNKELIVEYATNAMRHEIWLQCSIPPHPGIIDFYGWFIFGSMLGFVTRKMLCTSSVFFSYLFALMQRGATTTTTSSKDETSSFIVSRVISHLENDFHEMPPKRIVNGVKYSLKMCSILRKLESLFDLYKSNDLHKIRTVLIYFTRVAAAIGHLHQNDIVHRDLKPSNIMLDANGVVKLIDFELSTNISKLLLAQVVGTAIYQPVNYSEKDKIKVSIYDDGSIDVYAVMKMIEKTMKPFVKRYEPIAALCEKLRKSMSYMEQYVLVSYTVGGPDHLRSTISRNEGEYSFVLRGEIAQNRVSILKEVVTADKLKSILTRCMRKLGINDV